MDSHIPNQLKGYELEQYIDGGAGSQDPALVGNTRDVETRPDVLLRLGKTPSLKVSLLTRSGRQKTLMSCLKY